MTNLNASPYHVEFDRGLALALLEEPSVGPAGQRAYRIEIQVNGVPLEGPVVFGRKQMICLLIAMAKLVRVVDRRGLPGEAL